MKIAFVYDVPYPWHKGGIEHILATEAEELAKEHEVHFFTLRWPGMSNEFVYKNVHYHCYGDANEENTYRHGRRSIREAFAFSIHSWNIFKFKFDFIITDQFPVLHLFPLRVYRLLRRSRLIIRIDEVWDDAYWKEYIGKVLGSLASWYSNYLAYSRTAIYVTNSYINIQKLRKHKIRDRRVRLFAPVLDSYEINKAIKNIPKEKRVIFAGRFIKEKRIDKWLLEFKRITAKDSNIKGIIIGNGVEKDNIQKQIKKLGLEEIVELKPFYKHKSELYRELARSSLFLQMSEREGLSIISLESLACGTPVLLPSYTTIPNEVKRMCIIEREELIPSKILEILRSNDNSIFMKNIENLKVFSSKDVLSFYNRLFSEIK